jgi:CubicO group peptidase (beta-lactamase class C family)
MRSRRFLDGDARSGGITVAPHTLLAVGAAVAFSGPPTPGTDAPSAPSTPWPTEAWTVAAPADHGLDPARLDALVERIRAGTVRDIHSLLIVKDGRLVLEHYFGGHAADRLHMQQSVSKSFTSALVGIAIEKGAFEGVEERVLDFFPGSMPVENLDERKRRITLDDLLTMRSGTDYHERGPGSPHFQLNDLSRGWTAFILDRPMVREPGTHFQYDSGAVILTSELIRRRYGVHADAFAEKHLFAPLGIERFRWYRNDDGHPHTGGGLSLRSRDMARFGLLYLREGRWEDRQIVPRAWVRASLKRHVEFDSPRHGAVGYGYWWWVYPPDPAGAGMDVYAACGFLGQYIFLVPEHDMVVVVTAGARGADQGAPCEFLYTDILPSVVRR